jgi:hypothetical protein
VIMPLMPTLSRLTRRCGGTVNPGRAGTVFGRAAKASEGVRRRSPGVV